MDIITIMTNKKVCISWLIGIMLNHMFSFSETTFAGCNPPEGKIPTVSKFKVTEVGTSNSKSIVVGPNNDNPGYLNIQNLNPLNQTKLKLKVYGTNQEYLGWRVERLSHKGTNCAGATQKEVSPEASPNEGGFDSSGEAETILTFPPSPDGFYIKLFCDGDNDAKQDIENLQDPPSEYYICDPDSEVVGSDPEVIEMTIINVDFLNNGNSSINPSTEALNVSNWVSVHGLYADDFLSTSLDPDNFRLEVNDASVSAPSVEVKVQVNTGAEVTYTLDAKSDSSFRGQFLRLVADEEDDAAGFDNSRTILVKLGDTVRMKYEPSPGTVCTHELQVGRPESENNNGGNQLMHDIRVLDIYVVVFRNQAGTAPAATRAQVDAEIEAMNERFAQSTIRVDATINMGGAGDPGVPLPAAMQNGFTVGAFPLTALNADETAIIAHKDANDNTLDFFYVTEITCITGNLRGIAYGQALNETGNIAADNFAVLGTSRDIYTICHEAMHLLLNSPHRNDHSTALFYGPQVMTPRSVLGPKRIGPYNETPPFPFGEHSGENDTFTIRSRVGALP